MQRKSEWNSCWRNYGSRAVNMVLLIMWLVVIHIGSRWQECLASCSCSCRYVLYGIWWYIIDVLIAAVKLVPRQNFCYEQEAHLSLTDRPALVHTDVKIFLTQNATKHSFPCCAVKSCPLVNDCDLLAGFFEFYLPLSHLTPSVREIPLSYRIHIWYGKTRMAGLQSGEGHMMMNSVIWVQYINVTDTDTSA